MNKLFAILLFSVLGFSQEGKIPVAILDTITIASEHYIGTDTYGYVYEANKEVLQKSKGLEKFQYKNVALGTIIKIDLLNPLQLVLFYENFNTVVILDNQLNETYRINFSEQNTPIVASAIGLAAQNKLWLFNEVNQQLMLFDKVKNNLRPLAQPFQKKMTYYQTSYNYFYWVDSEAMAYSCDLFGKISLIGKVPAFDSIQIISDGEAVFSVDRQLYFYQFKTKKAQLIDCCKKTFQSFSYKNQILTIFTDRKISYYKTEIN